MHGGLDSGVAMERARVSFVAQIDIFFCRGFFVVMDGLLCRIEGWWMVDWEEDVRTEQSGSGLCGRETENREKNLCFEQTTKLCQISHANASVTVKNVNLGGSMAFGGSHVVPGKTWVMGVNLDRSPFVSSSTWLAIQATTHLFTRSLIRHDVIVSRLRVDVPSSANLFKTDKTDSLHGRHQSRDSQHVIRGLWYRFDCYGTTYISFCLSPKARTIPADLQPPNPPSRLPCCFSFHELLP